MGFIDRARENEFNSFLEESQSATEAEDHERQLAIKRVEIVDTRLKSLADNFGESFSALTAKPIGLPRYYIIGDIVLMVQNVLATPEPDPSQPHLVRFAYRVSIVGLDGERRLTRHNVGTLQLLNDAGIGKAITTAPPNYEFRASEIEPYLPK